MTPLLNMACLTQELSSCPNPTRQRVFRAKCARCWINQTERERLPTQQNMARDEAITAIRFPIRLLTVACLLTIMAFAWFVWIIFDARRDTEMFIDRLSRIEELRGVIVHLDEVLTMSARMAAATGDSRWEERYHHFEPQLDAAIKETTKIWSQLLQYQSRDQDRCGEHQVGGNAKPRLCFGSRRS